MMDTIFALSSYLLGALTGLGLGYLLFKLRPQGRRIQTQDATPHPTGTVERLIGDHAALRGNKPVALSISLLPNNPSIGGNVETFLRSKGWSMPIEEFNLPGIGSTPEEKVRDLALLVTGLQKQKREFQVKGYDEIHLFIAGPVQAGTIIGALLDNWVPVKLYHRPNPAPPEFYEYWMPLIGS